MTWDDEQEHAESAARRDQVIDDLAVNALKNYFRNLDIELNLELKTDTQYRDEAILQLAAARERLASR